MSQDEWRSCLGCGATIKSKTHICPIPVSTPSDEVKAMRDIAAAIRELADEVREVRRSIEGEPAL